MELHELEVGHRARRRCYASATPSPVATAGLVVSLKHLAGAAGRQQRSARARATTARPVVGRETARRRSAPSSTMSLTTARGR